MRRICIAWLIAGLALAAPECLFAQSSKPDFPPHAEVLKGYEKVVSTADGKPSFYGIWIRKKDNQMLAELPKAYANQKHFLAMTVASGDRFAGLQSGDMYVYWRRFDKHLALIQPNVQIRSTGDAESKSSVKRLFTDRILLSVPIVTIGPSGAPMIDMDALLVGNSHVFFGSRVRPASRSMANLVTIKKAKAFPSNVELAFEVPIGSGTLQTLHYSISLIPDKTGYKPRAADERVGYFTTSYSDYGKYDDRETRVRYINRWKLEKADPKLKISPPKSPIVFYIEHTTPVRYRRWVREGILAWNRAFEKVGLSNAIEVRYQDQRSGAHMEKDPEDVRYNFVRWLNNDIGTAIGPSRVHPLTGEILDADIVLTDGWIRHFRYQFTDLMPELAMQGFSPATLSWLADHPNWDPRIRLAAPSQRSHIRSRLAQQGAQPFGGHAMSTVDPKLIGDDKYDGLIGRTSQMNGMCLASRGKAFDTAMFRMHLALLAEEEKNEKKDDKEDDKNLLDGMPESFIGPLLADLVSHEVGHTLGLRHNFKGSSLYTLDEINSKKLKGKKPYASSVMDYNPVNIRLKSGETQGDYTMIGIGPYDMWAIEYGYSFEKDLKPLLTRSAEPELQYGTDENTSGPDPLARRYDFSKNPRDYAQEQMALAKYHRGRILDKFVEEGESWSRARRGYEITLSMQMRSLSMMANWLGGTFVRRDKKGDKNGRTPLEVVPAEQQRAALKFVLENAFRDESFGLTPELMVHLVNDKWLDGDIRSAFEDASWPVHDRILGMQASTLTMLLQPKTLERIYDNEFRVPSEKDTITLSEVMEAVRGEIWSELEKRPDGKHTARKPMISSLRRNLQQEYLSRLIDLYLPSNGGGTASKPVSNLAGLQLRSLKDQMAKAVAELGEKIDPYSKAHLSEASRQIEKALESRYIYNANQIGGGGSRIIRFSKDEKE